MAGEIAELGIRVSTNEVEKANRDLDKFDRTGAKASKSADNLNTKTRKLGGGMGLLATGVGRAVAGLAAFAISGQAIAGIAEFEKSIAAVEAVSQATELQMDAMRSTALRLGEQTEFSAKQAGEGLLFLSRAGFSAEESMNAIPAVLDLSTAAMMDLGQAADITSNIMSAFGIRAENSAAVADILAAASSSANTDVSQLGEAMKFVGPVARSLGIDMGDAAAAIGVLSDAGIQGGMAGTGLRRVLSSLANPTNEAAEAINSLGLTVGELNPATNSLVEIISRLDDAGISAAQALTIFGDRGGPAILALTEGTPKLRELTEALTDVDGEAARMAATMRDNLGGDIDALKSAASGLILALGDAGVTAVLRGLVQVVTAVVRSFTALTNIIGTVTNASVDFFNKILFGVSNNQALQHSIDNVTVALGEQITQNNLMMAAIDQGGVMTLEAAKTKLAYAQATYDSIDAMIAERRQIALQRAGYDDLMEQIRETYEERDRAAAQMGRTDVAANLLGAFAKAYDDADEHMAALLTKQQTMLGFIDQATLLTDEENATRQQTATLIDQITDAISNSVDGMVSFNGELVSGNELGGRLSTDMAQILASINASAVASGNLAGGLNSAANQAASLASFLNGIPGAIADMEATTRGALAGIAAINAGGGVIESRVAQYRAELQATIPVIEGIDYATQAAAASGIDAQVAAYEAQLRAQDALSDTITSVNELGEAHVGAGGAAVEAAEETVDAIDKIKSINDSIKKTGEGILDNIFSGKYNSIGDFFKDLWGQFKGILGQMVSLAAKTSLSNIFGGLTGGGSGGGIASSLLGGGSGGGSGGGLFGGIIGQFTDGISAGLTNVVGGLFNGGLSGAWSGLTSSLSGITSGLSGFSTALGAALPVIGLVAAGMSFFSKKTIGAGIGGTLGGADGFDGYSYKKTSQFWGLSKKTSKSGLDSEVADPIAEMFTELRGGIVDMASSVGQDATDAIMAFTTKFKFDTRKMSEEDIAERLQEEIEKAGASMADLALGTDEFSQKGETALDTLTRLSSSITAVNDVFDDLGLRLMNISLFGADAASSLVDAVGGLDAFLSASQFYLENFYSESEQIGIATANLKEALSDIGVDAIPASTQAFRQLLTGLQEIGDTEAVGTLLKLAPAFIDLVDSTNGLASALDRTARSQNIFGTRADEQFAQGGLYSFSDLNRVDDGNAEEKRLLAELLTEIRAGNVTIARNTSKTAALLQRQVLEGEISAA